MQIDKRWNQGTIPPFGASLKDLGTTQKQNKKILEKQMQSVFVVFEAQRQNEKKGEENIMGINNLGEGRSPYKVLGKVSKN